MESMKGKRFEKGEERFIYTRGGRVFLPYFIRTLTLIAVIEAVCTMKYASLIFRRQVK